VEVLRSLVLLTEDTPFVIFLAIDARVIVQAIESNHDQFFRDAGISGDQYLDKVVQLPFAIPLITEPQRKHLATGYLLGGQPPAEQPPAPSAATAKSHEAIRVQWTCKTKPAPRKGGETKALEAAFREMDADGSGTITPAELRAMPAYHGTNTRLIERLIEMADFDGDGKIALDELWHVYFTECADDRVEVGVWRVDGAGGGQGAELLAASAFAAWAVGPSEGTVVRGLRADTEYRVRLRLCNEYGGGQWSGGEAVVRTKAGTPPPPYCC
jgi:hypothetical protein